MLERLKPFFKLWRKHTTVVPNRVVLSTLIKLALLKRIYPARDGVTVKFGNYTLSAPDYHMLSTLIKEKFVDNEYYFSASVNAPVIIDGGSNIGVSVLYFKCLYPDAEIHCFEPYSKAYKYLERNVKANGFEKVFLNDKALSDSGGRVALYIPDEKNTTNPTVNNFFRGTNLENVRSVRLSEYISHLPRVDLIKLDVESAEGRVVGELHANAGFSNDKIRELIIEFHASVIDDPDASDELISTLKASSYEVEVKVLYPGRPNSDLMIYAKRFF